MAKIWRRKRHGREIGGYYVSVKGKPVSLSRRGEPPCKDARVANRRARLALRGEWPDDSAARAAEAAAPAEHVPEAELLDDLDRGRAPVTQGPQPVGLAESPPPAAEPLCDEPDPAAAAAAAAAQVDAPASSCGPAPKDGGDLAREMGEALQREFFTTGEGQKSVGEMLASLCVSVEYQLGEAIARKRNPPRTIPEPTEADVVFRTLKCAFGVLGRKWTGNLEIHPGWVIAAVLLAYPIQMAVTAKLVEAGEPKAAEAN